MGPVSAVGLMTGPTISKTYRLHKRLLDAVSTRTKKDGITTSDAIRILLARYAVGELDVVDDGGKR